MILFCRQIPELQTINNKSFPLDFSIHLKTKEKDSEIELTNKRVFNLLHALPHHRS